MHDPEDMYDWHQDVLDVYRHVVATVEDESIQRQEAFQQAESRLLEMYDEGSLKIPANEAIRAALLEVDKRDGSRADAVLEAALSGQDSFGMEGDPILDVVVILGEGRRKLWRHVTSDDLREMDRLRYRNLRSQQHAYETWRDSYEPTLEALSRFPTFGDAVQHGGFA